MTSTPPRNGPKGEWTTPTCTRVLTLVENGVPASQISRLTGVPASTVGRWKRAPHYRRPITRSGRPPQLNKHDIHRLIGLIRSGWEGRKLCWHQLGKQAALDVSPRTISRALAKEGYSRCKACKKPFIGRAAQQSRKDYADLHLLQTVAFWRMHVYSDESIFDTSKRGSTWVTRLPYERYHDDCMQHTFHSGHGSVMAWGAISHNWKSPLILLEGTGAKGVTAVDYMEQVLEPVVAAAFCGLLGYNASPEAQFVEDQAPIHGTKKRLVEVKSILGIPLHHRPSCSPDLNPIEDVWRIMKQRIKARQDFPDTVSKMRIAVQEEWDRLEPRDWNRSIDSMPDRIQQVKQRKGMQTQY